MSTKNTMMERGMHAFCSHIHTQPHFVVSIYDKTQEKITPLSPATVHFAFPALDSGALSLSA